MANNSNINCENFNLENKSEICDLKVEENSGVSKNQLNEWEIKNFCSLPSDLKFFYLSQNGVSVEWKVKLENNASMPLGRMKINSLKDLTRVGSVLNKDNHEPSLFDLEDLQTSNDISSIKSNEDENKTEEKEPSPLTQSAKNFPHFDDSSRNFELDSCNGYGKVCLVYKRTRNGFMSSDHLVEIWFLDRSLQWHFLASSFKDYFRLMMAHLGLPQWQMIFTCDGLPPLFHQWFYAFCPGRIMIHEEHCKRMDYLTILENGNDQVSSNKKQPNNNHATNKLGAEKKIEFAKLFEDKTKNSKNCSNNSNSNPTNNNSSSNNLGNQSESSQSNANFKIKSSKQQSNAKRYVN